MDGRQSKQWDSERNKFRTGRRLNRMLMDFNGMETEGKKEYNTMWIQWMNEWIFTIGHSRGTSQTTVNSYKIIW